MVVQLVVDAAADSRETQSQWEMDYRADFVDAIITFDDATQGDVGVQLFVNGMKVVPENPGDLRFANAIDIEVQIFKTVEEGDRITLSVDNEDAATNHFIRATLEFEKKTPGRTMERYMAPTDKFARRRPPPDPTAVEGRRAPLGGRRRGRVNRSSRRRGV